MLYLYNNLAAEISVSKSQNNDFGRTVSLRLLISISVSCSHVTDYFFFLNSMVTVHIKPFAPHHTTVFTVSTKKNSITCSFPHVVSVRLSKNLAEDRTLAKSGCFTLSLLKFTYSIVSSVSFTNVWAIISLDKQLPPLNTKQCDQLLMTRNYISIRRRCAKRSMFTVFYMGETWILSNCYIYIHKNSVFLYALFNKIRTTQPITFVCGSICSLHSWEGL